MRLHKRIKIRCYRSRRHHMLAHRKTFENQNMLNRAIVWSPVALNLYRCWQNDVQCNDQSAYQRPTSHVNQPNDQSNCRRIFLHFYSSATLSKCKINFRWFLLVADANGITRNCWTFFVVRYRRRNDAHRWIETTKLSQQNDIFKPSNHFGVDQVNVTDVTQLTTNTITNPISVRFISKGHGAPLKVKTKYNLNDLLYRTWT